MEQVMKKLVYFLAIAHLFISCVSHDHQDDSYSFFVAGHTYGNPNGSNPGLHPPFIKSFGWINENEDIDFGILTGDIVRKSDVPSWDSVDAQLEKLRPKVYFCPGNHDIKNRELYESRYGKRFYSFSYANDLFIVMDGSLDRWNISGEQLEFLKEELQADPATGNIFLFIHQLVWWDEDNVFSKVNLNWPPYTPDTTNYWAEVEPLLQSVPVPVVIFAGDLGANNTATPVMYFKDKNITYIASGMGSIAHDNFIVVHMTDKREPEYKLFRPGDNIEEMGLLEEYHLDGL
jgi:hypothetical protein